MPDDDTPTEIGGAIDTDKKVMFIDIGSADGGMQIVSSDAGDTMDDVEVFYRDATGVLLSENNTLNGQTPDVYAATPERVLKAIKSGSTAGDIALESVTAVRSNTAQAGGANDEIILDAAASAVDGFYNGMVVRLTGGTGQFQIREVVAYTGATKKARVNRIWTANPDATTTFKISKGILFEKTPFEILEVRRPFYNASANAPGGGAVAYYEKIFCANTHATLTLTAAKVIESSDPSTKITFAKETVNDGTGTNGVGNNRKVAPSAGVSAFDSADKDVNGLQLDAAETMGVWLKLSLDDGDSAQKTTYTPRLRGNTV